MRLYNLTEKFVFRFWGTGRHYVREDQYEVNCWVELGPITIGIRMIQVLDCDSAYIEFKIRDHWFGYRRYYGKEPVGTNGFFHYDFG